MAPEALLYKQYSAKTDVWAYGCTLVEMVTRRLVFLKNNKNKNKINNWKREMNSASQLNY